MDLLYSHEQEIEGQHAISRTRNGRKKFNRLAQWMTNYEHCNLHMFEVVLLHTPQAFY